MHPALSLQFIVPKLDKPAALGKAVFQNECQ